jgi:signal transduction histidine kinase
MKKTGRVVLPRWRGFTAQLLAFTILPLTLLLLVIAFGSVYLHQQDMRALVGERDERAVQSAAAALESELHHRMATIASMVVFAGESSDIPFDKILATSSDLLSDFDGGAAFLDSDGRLIASTDRHGLWDWVSQNIHDIRTASSDPFDSPPLAPGASVALGKPGPVISDSFLDPNSKRTFVIISAYSPSLDLIAAGAFSPELLASQALSASYPADSHATIFLVDSSGNLLFTSGRHSPDDLPFNHSAAAEALHGGSGIVYVQRDNVEHVVAYSPIPLAGWALLSDEAWKTVVSPSLQITQVAPLVLVPAFLLALLTLWFGARQIVQPLQRLESKASAVAWGDYAAIEESVGGITEVQQLQRELTEMARKVQAAQEGLRDYIGAITYAQEEERNRLARELHDDTIQAVIALKQRVQLAKKSVKSKSGHEVLSELESLAEQTVENLRRLTRALRPIYLEDLGLVTALEMLARETSQANQLKVDFQISGNEQRLPREVELSLYRIAQEALNNVMHHARASHASLRITFGEDVRLDVTDDGVGFIVPTSPTDFAPSGHFGLLGIRERADLIGARFEVQSDAGRGTRLSVRLANPPYIGNEENLE